MKQRILTWLAKRVAGTGALPYSRNESLRLIARQLHPSIAVLVSADKLSQSSLILPPPSWSRTVSHSTINTSIDGKAIQCHGGQHQAHTQRLSSELLEALILVEQRK